MKSENLVPVITLLIVLAGLIFTSRYISILLYVFVPGTIAAFIIYFNTFYKIAPDPSELLPPYLLALAIQMIHFAEEYATGFDVKVAALLGEEPYSLNALVIFNMIAYFFFVLGGIAIYQKRKEQLVIPMIFIILGVFLNFFGHILASLYVGGYFPGLFTGLLYLLLIPKFLKLLNRKVSTIPG